MVKKLIQSILRTLGFISEDTEQIEPRRTQGTKNFRNENSDEIMVLEEPACKKIKTSHAEATGVNRVSYFSSKQILRKLKSSLYPTTHSSYGSSIGESTSSGYLSSEACLREAEHSQLSSILLKSALNKENMLESPKQNGQGISRNKNLSFDRPTNSELSTNFPFNATLSSEDTKSKLSRSVPKFRFSPSLTSTASKSSSFGVVKRSPIRPVSNTKSHSVNILHKRLYPAILKNNTSTMKNSFKPLLRAYDSSLSSRKLLSTMPHRLNIPSKNDQMKEKIIYQQMLQMCTTTPLPKKISVGNTSYQNATQSGALAVSPIYPKQLNNMKKESAVPSPTTASTSTGNVNLTDKLFAFSKYIGFGGSPAKKKDENSSEASDDVIITKEIKLPTTKPWENSLEMMCRDSKFYDRAYTSKHHSTHERKLQEKEQYALLIRKLKDRHEKMRRQTLDSSLNEVSRRMGQIDLSFPAIVKEIVLEEEVPKLPDLTTDILRLIDRAMRGGPPGQILADKFNIQIKRKDIHTLSGLNWLNDEVINFYMNLLMERGGKNKLPKVYAFNTFFYPKLIKMGYSSVKRWTKKVDVFIYDLLLVPIHLGMHWCLSTIDFRSKSIKYYDSMSGDNNRCLQELLRYLESEHQDKKKVSYDICEWRIEIVKDIPQQMNGSDCGMFSCKFAEYLSRNASITFNQDDMPYFRKRMVYEIVTQSLM